MELSYRQYTELMDELVSEGYNVLEASQMIFSGQLTEEQVWEGVENWVNALLGEGYDLTDYTWEEMYEAYLEEQGQRMTTGQATAPKVAPKPETINLKPQKGVTAGGNVTLGRGYEATLDGKKGQLSYVRGSQGRLQRTFRQLGSEANPPSAAQAKQDQADPRRNSASTPRPAVTPTVTSPRPAATRPATGIVRGSGPSTPSTPAAPTSPAKPATPTAPAAPAAPKPASATTTAAKPAATTPTAPKPATGMLGKTSFERRTPTSAELKAAQASRAGGEKNPEKVLQAAKAASTPKPAATPATGNTLSQTTAAASKPAAFSPTPAATPAAKPPLKKPIAAGFDMFDVVKGYLIGEGYADTEEAALAIMTNMSEEWRQSIIKSI